MPRKPRVFDDTVPAADRCYAVGGKTWGIILSNYQRCHMEGCRGTRLVVAWPDGHQTRPCSRGCVVREDKAWQIL